MHQQPQTLWARRSTCLITPRGRKPQYSGQSSWRDALMLECPASLTELQQFRSASRYHMWVAASHLPVTAEVKPGVQQPQTRALEK